MLCCCATLQCSCDFLFLLFILALLHLFIFLLLLLLVHWKETIAFTTSTTLLQCCGRFIVVVIFLSSSHPSPPRLPLFPSPPGLLERMKQLPYPNSTTLSHCYGRLHCSSDLVLLHPFLFIILLLLHIVSWKETNNCLGHQYNSTRWLQKTRL